MSSKAVPPTNLDTPLGSTGLIFSSNFDSGNLRRVELKDPEDSDD
eukprot:gene31159-12802_t